MSESGQRRSTYTTSMALFPYPSRFHGGTSGWVFPAASVARARSVCLPTSAASQRNVQSCHWYGPSGGCTSPGCQSPSPVRLTSMLVTGPCPDHALPLKVGEAVVALHVTENGVEGGQGQSRGEEVLHVGIPRAVEAGHERKPGVFVEEHEPRLVDRLDGHSVVPGPVSGSLLQVVEGTTHGLTLARLNPEEQTELARRTDGQPRVRTARRTRRHRASQTGKLTCIDASRAKQPRPHRYGLDRGSRPRRHAFPARDEPRRGDGGQRAGSPCPNAGSADRRRPTPGHSVAVRLKAYAHCVDGREDAADGHIAAARWKHRPWDTDAGARPAGWRSSASLWTSRGPAHDAKRWLTAEPQAGGLA